MSANGLGLETGVFGLKGPGNESGEAPGGILLCPYPLEVLHPIFKRLDMTKHHRRRRVQTHPMRYVHHPQPFITHGLERCDALTHAVHQDFSPAAGDGSQTCFLELSQQILHGQIKHLLKMNELARAEGMDVDLRELFFDVREHVQIPVQGQRRVVSTLHQDLVSPQSNGFLDLLIQLFFGDDVGIFVLGGAIESAELAVDVADVGVVDVAIDIVGDDLVAAPVIGLRLGQFAATMRQRTQHFQGKLVELCGLSSVHPLAFPHFFHHCIHGGINLHAANVIASEVDSMVNQWTLDPSRLAWVSGSQGKGR